MLIGLRYGVDVFETLLKLLRIGLCKHIIAETEHGTSCFFEGDCYLFSHFKELNARRDKTWCLLSFPPARFKQVTNSTLTQLASIS